MDNYDDITLDKENQFFLRLYQKTNSEETTQFLIEHDLSLFVVVHKLDWNIYDAKPVEAMRFNRTL